MKRHFVNAWLIGSVNLAMAYHDDVDEAMENARQVC
jgi:hypothetical protein